LRRAAHFVSAAWLPYQCTVVNMVRQKLAMVWKKTEEADLITSAPSRVTQTHSQPDHRVPRRVQKKSMDEIRNIRNETRTGWPDRISDQDSINVYKYHVRGCLTWLSSAFFAHRSSDGGESQNDARCCRDQFAKNLGHASSKQVQASSTCPETIEFLAS
jgi:hypothetical protein